MLGTFPSLGISERKTRISEKFTCEMLAALKHWFTKLHKAVHGRRLITGRLVNVVVAKSLLHQLKALSQWP
jgi:hypothetical protein